MTNSTTYLRGLADHFDEIGDPDWDCPTRLRAIAAELETHSKPKGFAVSPIQAPMTTVRQYPQRTYPRTLKEFLIQTGAKIDPEPKRE